MPISSGFSPVFFIACARAISAAASTGWAAAGKRTLALYERLLACLGPEFPILDRLPLEEISPVAGPQVTEGIRRLRLGEVDCRPGFDGQYGRMFLR